MSNAEWIKCSDKMPNNNEKVILYIDHNVYPYTCIGYYSVSDDIRWYRDSRSKIKKNPIHWMPLPNPPKE